MPGIGLKRGHGALVAPDRSMCWCAWMKQRIANTLGVPRFRALVRRQTPTSCLSVSYSSLCVRMEYNGGRKKMKLLCKGGNELGFVVLPHAGGLAPLYIEKGKLQR